MKLSRQRQQQMGAKMEGKGAYRIGRASSSSSSSVIAFIWWTAHAQIGAHGGLRLQFTLYWTWRTSWTSWVLVDPISDAGFGAGSADLDCLVLCTDSAATVEVVRLVATPHSGRETKFQTRV